MKKRIVSLLCLAGASLSLQGCVTTFASLAMQGLEGSGYCPPEVRVQAQQVSIAIQNLYGGLTIEQVMQDLGKPTEWHQVTLRNGASLDVWFYRTGHEKCRGMPTEEKYTPVVFQQRLLIGTGHDYYNQYIARYIRRDVTLVSEVSDNEESLWDMATYPFNKAF